MTTQAEALKALAQIEHLDSAAFAHVTASNFTEAQQTIRSLNTELQRSKGSLRMLREFIDAHADGVQTCPRCGRAAANLFRMQLPGDDLDTVHCGCVHVPKHLTPEVIAGVTGTAGKPNS